jgi:hypothetical protein
LGEWDHGENNEPQLSLTSPVSTASECKKARAVSELVSRRELQEAGIVSAGHLAIVAVAHGGDDVGKVGVVEYIEASARN